MPRISSEGFAGDAARDSRGWGDEAIASRISGKGRAEGARLTIEAPNSGLRVVSNTRRSLGNSGGDSVLDPEDSEELADATGIFGEVLASEVLVEILAKAWNAAGFDTGSEGEGAFCALNREEQGDCHDRTAIDASRAAS